MIQQFIPSFFCTLLFYALNCEIIFNNIFILHLRCYEIVDISIFNGLSVLPSLNLSFVTFYLIFLISKFI